LLSYLKIYITKPINLVMRLKLLHAALVQPG